MENQVLENCWSRSKKKFGNVFIQKTTRAVRRDHKAAQYADHILLHT